MSATTTTDFEGGTIGSLTLSDVLVTETDSGPGSFDTFASSFSSYVQPIALGTGGYQAIDVPPPVPQIPGQFGVVWGATTAEIQATNPTAAVTQSITYSADIGIAAGNVISSAFAEIAVDNDWAARSRPC